MRGPGMLMSNTSLGEDISPLELLVESMDPNILHIKIGAPGRWEVPKDDIFINTNQGVFHKPGIIVMLSLSLQAGNMPVDQAIRS